MAANAEVRLNNSNDAIILTVGAFVYSYAFMPAFNLLHHLTRDLGRIHLGNAVDISVVLQGNTHVFSVKKAYRLQRELSDGLYRISAPKETYSAMTEVPSHPPFDRAKVVLTINSIPVTMTFARACQILHEVSVAIGSLSIDPKVTDFLVVRVGVDEQRVKLDLRQACRLRRDLQAAIDKVSGDD